LGDGRLEEDREKHGGEVGAQRHNSKLPRGGELALSLELGDAGKVKWDHGRVHVQSNSSEHVDHAEDVELSFLEPVASGFAGFLVFFLLHFKATRLLVSVVVLESLSRQLGLVDRAHVEQGGHGTDNDSRNGHCSELLSLVLNQEEHGEGEHENHNVCDVREPIARVHQVVSAALAVAELSSDGEMSNLNRGPTNIEDSRKRNVPSVSGAFTPVFKEREGTPDAKE